MGEDVNIFIRLNKTFGQYCMCYFIKMMKSVIQN